MTSQEVELYQAPQPVEKIRKIRTTIPEEHRISDDARIVWLWNQRMITVQTIYMRSPDPRDKLAANLVINAAWSGDLGAIELLLKRLEGGAVQDQAIQEDETLPI